MSANLAPYVASGTIRHARASAVAVTRGNGGYLITLSDGSALEADILVLAILTQVRASRTRCAGSRLRARLHADPYDNQRIAAIGDDARVLVVGTGLTSADIVASCVARGFRGRITCLSRHGLRSRDHGVVTRASAADFGAEPLQSATGLLRRIRRAVAEDARQGQSWHAALDRGP